MKYGERLWIVILGLFCINDHTLFVAGNGHSGNHQLETLVREFFQWRISEWPEYATKVGVPTYNNKVENYTEAAFLQEKTTAQGFLARADAIDMNFLDTQESVSLAVLKDLLKTFISGYDYRKYSIYNFMAPLENIVSKMKKMVFTMPRKTVEDYRNILARYRLLPQQIQDMIGLMKISVAAKTTAHTTSVNYTITILTELLKSVNSSNFFEPFMDSAMPAAIQEPERSNLRNQAFMLIKDGIFPNLTAYRDYLQNGYLPHARTAAGVGTLPGGQEYYKACLKWHISVDMTPREVHDLGLREVQRISQQMSAIMKESGFKGTLKEFITSLLADPTNFYDTSDQLLQAYKDIISAVHSKLGTILLKVPNKAVDVRANSQHVDRYSAPSPDGSTPGIFWADVKNPKDKPKFNMVALTLHEAEPGHHTQTTYMVGQNIPDFRKYTEYLRYNAVPFNWLFHTAYSEGWALYAESLGEEMGIYTQPYSLFGRYASEIHRATRLVVDTGMHAFGWTIPQAESYMRNYTTLGDITICNEVRRYISWPGQACSYKIGEIKIRELREISRKELGSKFDLREFHHEILSFGSVPISLLENHVKEWISKKLGNGVTVSSGEILKPYNFLMFVLVQSCLAIWKMLM